jgi:hypothetical protein
VAAGSPRSARFARSGRAAADAAAARSARGALTVGWPRGAQEDERLRRAAGALRLIEDRFAGAVHGHAEAQPFRWGTVATDGIGTMRRCLHATAAGIEHTKGVRAAVAGQFDDAKAHAANARKHRAAAGTWDHDSRLEPPLFGKAFAKKSDALLQALWAQGRRTAAEAMAPAERAATIGVWHATAEAAADAGAKQLAAAAAAEAADHVVVGWARDLRDPRPGAPEPPGDRHAAEAAAINAIRAAAPAATWHPQKNPAPPDVARFIAVNHEVYPVTAMPCGVADPVGPESTRKYTAAAALPPVNVAAVELPEAPPTVLGYPA